MESKGGMRLAKPENFKKFFRKDFRNLVDKGGGS